MKKMIKTGLGAFLTASLMLGSCTSDFENINQDDRKVTDEQTIADGFSSGGRIQTMQQALYINNVGGFQNWVFQVQQNLNADMWSGYMTTATAFAGNAHNNVYNFNTGWNSYMWDQTYEHFMPASFHLQKFFEGSPEIIGANLIVRVAMMHKVSDYYGSIIYRNYANDKTCGEYESQESVYKAFFQDLDVAVANLDEFVTAYPEGKPLKKYDLMFEGDFTKWIKYANSLRLRLAVRVAYVDANLAKTEAEKALANKYGVIEENADNAQIKIGNYTNPLGEVVQAWGDNRLGASFGSYLSGFNDPRASKMAIPASGAPVDGQYVGVRLGCDIDAKDAFNPEKPDIRAYLNYASVNISKSTSPVLFSAAEAWLLRAEGAVRGWNMKATAEEAYKKGIKVSMDQWGAAYDETAYLADNTLAPYSDGQNSANDASALTTLTPKWEDGADNVTKIEKIVTQRWIACFPDGTEGWAEVRRSGFPKIYPVVNNVSTEVPQGEFVKRARFSINDEARNPKGYAAAVQAIGGTDSHNVRLWWDKADKSVN